MQAIAWGQGVAANPDYNSFRGPIPVRDGRPYNLLFLQFFPELPDVLPSGANRFGAQLDVFNNMLIPTPTHGSVVTEDNEEQRLLLSLRRGVAGGELGVFVPIEYRDGGFMDPIIEAWHEVWSIDSANRDDLAGRGLYPQFRSILFWQDASGTHVNEGNAFGLGDVSATFKHALVRPTHRFAVSLRAGIKLPTGNPGKALGSGGLDVGLMLDMRFNLARSLIFFTGVGQVKMGHATRVPSAEPSMYQYQYGLELLAGRRDSFVACGDVGGLAVRTGNSRADQTQSTFTLGYEHVLDRHNTLYMSFSENGDWLGYVSTLMGSVGPDYTTTIGVRWWP